MSPDPMIPQMARKLSAYVDRPSIDEFTVIKLYEDASLLMEAWPSKPLSLLVRKTEK